MARPQNLSKTYDEKKKGLTRREFAIGAGAAVGAMALATATGANAQTNVGMGSIAYQHWWSPKLYSLGTYGWLWQDNRGVQAPTAYHETMYSSLNLTWIPDPRWLLGAEVVYGSREDKDGESGSNVRSVITSRFNF